MVNKKAQKRLFVTLICMSSLLLGLILTTAEFAQSQGKVPAVDAPPLQDLMQIIPKSDNVQFHYSQSGGGRYGPWSSSVTIDVIVRSHLPEWSAALEPVNAQGPEGTLPSDRLWIKTEETGGDFQQLTHAVPVLTGDLRLPVRETSLQIEVRPTWQDPPGDYEGILTFTAAGPSVTMKPSKFSSPRVIDKTSKNQMDATPGKHITPVPGHGVPFSGLPGQVHFSLSIPEILEIALLDAGQLTFSGDGPEGTYTSQQEIRFRVRTNARRWKVIAKADNLISERGEVSAERIKWERVNQYGQILEEGDLGENNVVLHSGTKRLSPEEEQILRFTLDISMSDVAGSYKGNISLQGVTGD